MAVTASDANQRRRERAYERGVPRPASEARANNMRAVKRAGTEPELRLRRALHASGLRYRVDLRLVLSGHPVRPDIVFTRHRLAVFVDSCFWHRCPMHGTFPLTNADWWAAKLARNVERDAQTDELLQAHGWTVIRAWEHEPTPETVRRIYDTLDITHVGRVGRQKGPLA